MQRAIKAGAVLALTGIGFLTENHAAEKKGGYVVHSFTRQQLTDEFWAEGAHFGDFNKDGNNDIASGPYWYEGPDFKKRNEFYPATESFTVKDKDGVEKKYRGFKGGLSGENAYSKNFLMFTGDYNGDGWTDIFVVGFPGEKSFWYENPKGKEGHWPEHVVINVTDNESASVGDINGDGKPDLYCASEGYYGFATIAKDPTALWNFTRVTPNNKYHKFTHGIGIGDVNGDGRMDLLEKDGWWEQPATLTAGSEWKRHAFTFGTGGSQMYAYDFDGDGDNDVLTALAGHGYGIAWFEQVKENGAISFKEHTFINKEPSENKYGVKFSQPHAVELMDMDNDGVKDIVTGKRFWAHGPTGDPEPNAPAVLYWFKTVRSGKEGVVDFVPYLIDDNSGVGTQVVAGKVDKDQWPDVIVGNKKGTFFFKHEVKEVSREEWEKAQPKPFGK